MTTLYAYLKLLRVHQWVKNLFIFLPAFFAIQLLHPKVIVDLAITFFAFGLMASSVYIFNDMLDVNEDRLHPDKKNRPLASGTISQKNGIILILVLLFCSAVLFLHFYGEKNGVLIVAALYLVQNILYSIKLKHIVLLDVMLIAVGFVMRIVIGGYASNTILSHWIVLMTFVLALFLALAKRRDDVLFFNETGGKARKNLDGYNLDFLNVSITAMATIVFVCYIMYCTSDGIIRRFGNNVYFTSFFVLFGLLQYLQLTFVQQESGSPTKVLLKNRFLQLVIAGWIISFYMIIYFKF